MNITAETLGNGFTVFIFVLISVGILELVRRGAGQFIKWDIGEREKAVQQELIRLKYEAEKYREEISDLRKQIKLLLVQYDEAVVKLAALEQRYNSAMRDAEDLREELDSLRRGVRSPEEKSSRILIAAIGSKKTGIGLDLASLRAVEEETGLRFQRITEATPEKLKIELDRARMSKQITYLHLSVESDQEGYMLMDTEVSADWLSEVLRGVMILVVAGSESANIGDFLGVVPYVVSMSDKIVSRDAALFSRAFWSEIGRGYGPNKALTMALRRAPSGMSEYVVKHWVD